MILTLLSALRSWAGNPVDWACSQPYSHLYVGLAQEARVVGVNSPRLFEALINHPDLQGHFVLALRHSRLMEKADHLGFFEALEVAIRNSGIELITGYFGLEELCQRVAHSVGMRLPRGWGAALNPILEELHRREKLVLPEMTESKLKAVLNGISSTRRQSLSDEIRSKIVFHSSPRSPARKPTPAQSSQHLKTIINHLLISLKVEHRQQAYRHHEWIWHLDRWLDTNESSFLKFFRQVPASYRSFCREALMVALGVKDGLLKASSLREHVAASIRSRIQWVRTKVDLPPLENARRAAIQIVESKSEQPLSTRDERMRAYGEQKSNGFEIESEITQPRDADLDYKSETESQTRIEPSRASYLNLDSSNGNGAKDYISEVLFSDAKAHTEFHEFLDGLDDQTSQKIVEVIWNLTRGVSLQDFGKKLKNMVEQPKVYRIKPNLSSKARVYFFFKDGDGIRIVTWSSDSKDFTRQKHEIDLTAAARRVYFESIEK